MLTTLKCYSIVCTTGTWEDLIQGARRVRLKDLPEFGLFWTAATERRGLLLKWWRIKPKGGTRNEKWGALVYLLGKGRVVAERRYMHAEAVVLVHQRDDVTNFTQRSVGDPWRNRWLVEKSRRAARSATGVRNQAE